MHRLTAALLIASAVSLVAIGVLLPAAPAKGWLVEHNAPQAEEIAIYMSATENGPRQTNFLSDTNKLFAVLEYENAGSEEFVIRLRDLSGIVVVASTTPPLTGSGKHSAEIAIDDFVDSYERTLDEQETPLTESIDLAAEYCQNPPAAPSVWPPEEPGPGVTPTPDPYMGWSEAMLTTLEQTRSSSAEMTRTLQALQTLPDVGTELPDTYTDLGEARTLLISANTLLAGVPLLLRPSAPPTPTPGPGPTPTTAPPPLPDPQQACGIVAQAKGEIETALQKTADSIATIPDDLSLWRLPGTTARYEEDEFVGCLQYKTDLLAVIGGSPQDTPSASAAWTVGDPGEPALMFPNLDLVDPSGRGLLGLSLPESAVAMYSRKVMVDGANHEAGVSAFVTDRNCIPVDGVNVEFWTAPPEQSGGASLDPATVPLDDGRALTTLMAGDEATGDFEAQPPKLAAWVFACAGPGCSSGIPTPQAGQVPEDQVWGMSRFEVIGTVDVSMTRLIVHPEKINRLSDETAGITLQVHDRNGQQVAAGTALRVWIPEDSPGMLGYDRYRLVNGRRAGDPERVSLGKSADLVVGSNGLSRILPDDDPGYETVDRLYLFAGDDANGLATICWEGDDASSCSVDVVQIVSETIVYLPVSMKGHDVHAKPTYLPLPLSEADESGYRPR